MSHIVQSLEHAVEAGVKGIIDIAEGYLGAGGRCGSPTTPSDAPPASNVPNGNGDTAPQHLTVSGIPDDTSSPIPISLSSDPAVQTSSPTSPTISSVNAPASSLAARLALVQHSLVQLTDVQSGWIHLQSTYLDSAGGQRRVRSFGLRNVSSNVVDVEVGSDLGTQVVFWVGGDDAASESSAASSASSQSNSAGSPSITLSIPAGAVTTVFLAFQPSTSRSSTPAGASTPSSEGGFTPRVLPAAANADVPPIQGGNRLPSPVHSNAASSILSDGVSNSTISTSGMSVSTRDGTTSTSGPRRSDPVHRSFSVHGSILVHATAAQPSEETDVLATPSPVHQNITLPFFASVCRSFFTAAAIDQTTSLISGAQLSSGQLTIDFGTDNIVGNEVHRDILLVNRSEIDLVWTTAIVNSPFKDSVWFSLRDLDSENVFGVDTSAEPVPLPALSSRHLRLLLRASAPVSDFEFEFLISNIHQSGNVVTVKAVGSCESTSHADTLRILSGSALDFGQIADGVWAKKLISTKNAGDRPLDVHFSATPGYEVVFRLAGVAGEDIDDEDVVPIRPVRDKRTETLSRTSTRDTRESGPHRGRDSASTASYTSQAIPANARSQLLAEVGSVGSATADTDDWSGVTLSDRDSSMPPSRPLSRVTSRTSSNYRPSKNDVDSDDDQSSPPMYPTDPVPATEASRPSDNLGDRDIPNQIEELTMRPGTEYRVFAMFRPARDLTNPPEIAGALRTSSFKVFLDSAPSSHRSRLATRSRKVIHASAESCTSVIRLPSGHLIDFGEVTVGASKTTSIQIENLSALSARVEISAISKVLMTNRNVIIIPPFETVNERVDFFPRRINDKYEKQVFVRNLLNRANNQLIDVHSKNVDVYNVTLHSHLYRILTPSGSNFLDFGPVVINSPSVRTVQFQNLTHKPLTLEMCASQPEDVELYIKRADAATAHAMAIANKYAADADTGDRPANGNLKERFVESLQDQNSSESKPPVKSKVRDKSVTKEKKDGEKQSLSVSQSSALRKGGRGRPVQLYGNGVMFKDRALLDDCGYLDLAAGPPGASQHRILPHSKRSQLLESIALEDKCSLSGKHRPTLDFAAHAKSSGLMSKEKKKAKTTSGPKRPPSTPVKSSTKTSANGPTSPTVTPMKPQLLKQSSNSSTGAKSPALTGKRIELKVDPANAADLTQLSPEELIVAIEQHDAKRNQSTVTHLTPEEEEQYVRRLLALRKELQSSITTGKFVPARLLTVPPGASRHVVVVMTPNGSTRPHVTTRAKRAESRIYIKALDYDHSTLSDVVGHKLDSELPVRDLVIRSSCVRSVLEVQQSSINFGTCERGEVKSRTIVIHNKSDCVGVFRMRTSGSIASGNLKLGLGRYGVVSAFGRKEVASFSFTPSLAGNYQENIAVENVLDSYNDQNVQVKATVRKMPAFALDVTNLEIAPAAPGSWPSATAFVLTNTSKTDRTFVIEASEGKEAAFAEISLSRDEKDAGVALSKGEEEEVEGLLQKMKIARRKNKPDKIAKYEKRLGELGVTTTSGDDVPTEMEATPASGTVTPGEVLSNPSITVTLEANKKAKILVSLVPAKGSEAFSSAIKVYERKNTDETVTIDVSASPRVTEPNAPAASSRSDEDPLNLAIMRHCLSLTLQCPVSPTAFCVGSTIFLPITSPLFSALEPHFPTFPDPTTGAPAGLLLADGYSRQIPGNTHAEANALANFRERIVELDEAAPGTLPEASDVLAQSSCYATMEPCSLRTSGGPSCALELVRAHIKSVYLGVEEPPDFVDCQGVRILEQGNVQVRRVLGLEEECLRCARRGRT